MVFGCFKFEVFIYGKYHGGSELFGAESVSAAYDLNVGNALFQKSGTYVEVERLAERAGFLRPVENGNFLTGFGYSRNECVRDERSVKTYFYKSVFFALGVEFVYRLFDGFATGAHTYYNFLRFGVAHVVEQVVFSAVGVLGYEIHHFLHNSGRSFIIAVRRFSVLEIGIAVLRGAFLNGMLGV